MPFLPVAQPSGYRRLPTFANAFLNSRAHLGRTIPVVAGIRPGPARPLERVDPPDRPSPSIASRSNALTPAETVDPVAGDREVRQSAPPRLVIGRGASAQVTAPRLNLHLQCSSVRRRCVP